MRAHVTGVPPMTGLSFLILGNLNELSELTSQYKSHEEQSNMLNALGGIPILLASLGEQRSPLTASPCIVEWLNYVAKLVPHGPHASNYFKCVTNIFNIIDII